MRLSLSDIEVLKLNEEFIRQGDKWYRMAAGLGTDLIKYKLGFLFIDVQNTENRILSTKNTAMHHACRRMKSKEEFEDALGFVMAFKRPRVSPGFLISPKGIAPEKFKKFFYLTNLIQELDVPATYKMFLGIFPEEDKIPDQDVRPRDNDSE